MNQQEKSGMTALHACALKDLPAPARALLERRGAKVRLLDNTGKPPLHYAVMRDRSKVARVVADFLKAGGGGEYTKKLLEASKDISGVPALHVAAEHDNADGIGALCPWGDGQVRSCYHFNYQLPFLICIY